MILPSARLQTHFSGGTAVREREDLFFGLSLLGRHCDGREHLLRFTVYRRILILQAYALFQNSICQNFKIIILFKDEKE